MRALVVAGWLMCSLGTAWGKDAEVLVDDPAVPAEARATARALAGAIEAEAAAAFLPLVSQRGVQKAKQKLAPKAVAAAVAREGVRKFVGIELGAGETGFIWRALTIVSSPRPRKGEVFLVHGSGYGRARAAVLALEDARWRVVALRDVDLGSP